jgi:hypothetical protein
VIVRIATEGQYEIAPNDEEALRALDNQAATACMASDEQQFHDSFARLLDFVRAHGRPVPDDELASSDLIVPPPDTSLEEAKAEFTGEGLIPS